jgi:hypothetical protein
MTEIKSNWRMEDLDNTVNGDIEYYCNESALEKSFEKAKKIIKEHYREANCGIFSSRNIVGDRMTTIYADEYITIDICYGWSYFEVFGLPKKYFNLLEKYYDCLSKRR